MRAHQRSRTLYSCTCARCSTAVPEEWGPGCLVPYMLHLPAYAAHSGRQARTIHAYAHPCPFDATSAACGKYRHRLLPRGGSTQRQQCARSGLEAALLPGVQGKALAVVSTLHLEAAAHGHVTWLHQQQTQHHHPYQWLGVTSKCSKAMTHCLSPKKGRKADAWCAGPGLLLSAAPLAGRGRAGQLRHRQGCSQPAPSAGAPGHACQLALHGTSLMHVDRLLSWACCTGRRYIAGQSRAG